MKQERATCEEHLRLYRHYKDVLELYEETRMQDDVDFGIKPLSEQAITRGKRYAVGDPTARAAAARLEMPDKCAVYKAWVQAVEEALEGLGDDRASVEDIIKLRYWRVPTQTLLQISLKLSLGKTTVRTRIDGFINDLMVIAAKKNLLDGVA